MMFKRIAISAIVLIGSGIMAFTNDFSANEDVSEQLSKEVESYDAVVVLELFTSQGCSSCPPADALLDKVKNEFGAVVFPLSYHVDYWDYIGWKDPFGKAEYAKKQREYNIKFKNKTNYTPQLVINGTDHIVGSSTSKVYGAINAYETKKTSNEVKLSNVRADKESISFDYAISGSTKNKNIRAVLVLDQRVTEVKRGENRNRTLSNSNIVVAEKAITLAGSLGEAFMAIPEIVNPQEKISLVVLVESEDYDITAAAKSAVKR